MGNDINAGNHIIERGETLTSIAKKYGTTVDQLQKDNNIEDPDKIYAGNSLKIGNTADAPKSSEIWDNYSPDGGEKGSSKKADASSNSGNSGNVESGSSSAQQGRETVGAASAAVASAKSPDVKAQTNASSTGSKPQVQGSQPQPAKPKAETNNGYARRVSTYDKDIDPKTGKFKDELGTKPKSGTSSAESKPQVKGTQPQPAKPKAETNNGYARRVSTYDKDIDPKTGKFKDELNAKPKSTASTGNPSQTGSQPTNSGNHTPNASDAKPKSGTLPGEKPIKTPEQVKYDLKGAGKSATGSTATAAKSSASSFGTVAKGVARNAGRVAKPIAAGYAALEIHDAYKKGGSKEAAKTTAKVGTKLAGAWAGAKAGGAAGTFIGAKLGALAGSIVPGAGNLAGAGIGAAVGGFVGGVAGGIGGWFAADKLASAVIR